MIACFVSRKLFYQPKTTQLSFLPAKDNTAFMSTIQKHNTAFMSTIQRHNTAFTSTSQKHNTAFVATQMTTYRCLPATDRTHLTSLYISWHHHQASLCKDSCQNYLLPIIRNLLQLSTNALSYLADVAVPLTLHTSFLATVPSSIFNITCSSVSHITNATISFTCHDQRNPNKSLVSHKHHYYWSW